MNDDGSAPGRAIATGVGPAPVGRIDAGGWSVTRIFDATIEAPPAAGQVVRTEPRWQRRYALAVVVNDLAATLLSILVGLWAGYGLSFTDPGTAWLLGGVTVVGTAWALYASRAWDGRILGQGSEEFNQLIRAIVSSSVVLGLVGLALSAPGIRVWVFVVIPVAGLLASIGRAVLRSGLHAARRQGRCSHPVLAVGNEDAIAELVRHARMDPHRGWTVAGACTPGGIVSAVHGIGAIDGVPVVGDLDGLATTVRRGGYRVVAVAPSSGWSSQRLQQLAWDLEGTGVDLVVQPGLMEVAGPRLHVTPVDGLPLLRLTEPSFTGIPMLVKAVADRVVSLAMIIFALPVLVGIAIAVKLDGGPVFFRQVRVGKDGRTFRMIKFRSMVVGADRMRGDLLERNEGAGPLFKLQLDPRTTPIGRKLRKYSLDELPQLFNVLAGSMSLVGPRPPLPTEVASYTRAAMRKLMVKPGLTGLWQISGRSDLSWEDSVRLDLRYVENWNAALDLQILWRTAGAVLRGDGAY